MESAMEYNIFIYQHYGLTEQSVVLKIIKTRWLEAKLLKFGQFDFQGVKQNLILGKKTKFNFKVKNKIWFLGEKPFKCDHCDFRCSRSSSLRTHERRRHGVGLQQLPDGTGNEDPPNGLTSGSANLTSGRSHVCEVCGKAFFTKQTLQVIRYFELVKQWDICRIWLNL